MNIPEILREGRLLPNGRRVLRSVQIDKDTFCVLAVNKVEVQKYVTWLADKDGNTYWGHYFSYATDALNDYYNRCGVK